MTLPRHLVFLGGEKKNCVFEPIVVVRVGVDASNYEGDEWSVNDADIGAKRLAASHCEKVCQIVEKAIGKEAKALEKSTTNVGELQVQMKDWTKRHNRMEYYRKAGVVVSRHEGDNGVPGAEKMLLKVRAYLVWIGRAQDYAAFLERVEELISLMRQKQRLMVQYRQMILTTGT